MDLPVPVAGAWTPVCRRDDWIPSRKSGEAHDLERNTLTVAVLCELLMVLDCGCNSAESQRVGPGCPTALCFYAEYS